MWITSILTCILCELLSYLLKNQRRKAHCYIIFFTLLISLASILIDEKDIAVESLVMCIRAIWHLPHNCDNQLCMTGVFEFEIHRVCYNKRKRDTKHKKATYNRTCVRIQKYRLPLTYFQINVIRYLFFFSQYYNKMRRLCLINLNYIHLYIIKQ